MHVRHLALASAALLSACTCSEPPTIQGTVVDLWGQPVEGVAVHMDGVDHDIVSDSSGGFSLPMVREASLKLDGGGIIPLETTVVPDSIDTTFTTTIEAIPEPETPGLHLVGPESYLPLPGEPVVRVGNELRTWQGIKSSGDVTVGGAPFRVVFHTSLKRDEVAQLDIELHRLEFVETTEVATVDGPQEVDVNLWTSAGKVKYGKQGLSPANWLLRVDELPAGTWAFSSMDLLDPKSGRFASTAESIRKVHPFTME